MKNPGELEERYITFGKQPNKPRLPLRGSLDITYRCNNNCRHCWIRIPHDSHSANKELSYSEIKVIVDEAIKWGCRKWILSGGEPMLRADFPDIFDYLTRKSTFYFLNTNGTMITPRIARLMKRKGMKMIALYGASAKVHDNITRNPGSFEAMMQGIAYLKEAKANFIIQIVPMRDNYSQLEEMRLLATSLTGKYRIGANWLHLSASGDQDKNKEIKHQRLPAPVASGLNKERFFNEKSNGKKANTDKIVCAKIFAACIENRSDFYVDPYGFMTFCSFIKDPNLLYDLRKGEFSTGWSTFIPSIKNKVLATKEYKENCGSCGYYDDCLWCPAYAFLEHRRYCAKVEYLCKLAKIGKDLIRRVQVKNCCHFRLADTTIKVTSSIPITKSTFCKQINLFRVENQKSATVFIRYHFFVPKIKNRFLSEPISKSPPWEIYRRGTHIIYIFISPFERTRKYIAVANEAHTKIDIYIENMDIYLKGNLRSLAIILPDDLYLSKIIAEKRGCIFNSMGMVIKDKGFLVINCDTKSNIAYSTESSGTTIVNDKQVAVLYKPRGYQLCGTWNQERATEGSCRPCTLSAIIYMKKYGGRDLKYVTPTRFIKSNLKKYAVAPLFANNHWLKKNDMMLEELLTRVPCYVTDYNNLNRLDLLLFNRFNEQT